MSASKRALQMMADGGGLKAYMSGGSPVDALVKAQVGNETPSDSTSVANMISFSERFPDKMSEEGQQRIDRAKAKAKAKAKKPSKGTRK